MASIRVVDGYYRSEMVGSIPAWLRTVAHRDFEAMPDADFDISTSKLLHASPLRPLRPLLCADGLEVQSSGSSSPKSRTTANRCFCRACRAERLVEYVGQPCSVSGLKPPIPFWTEASDNGNKYCACDCSPCRAYCLLDWVGRRCERSGMYPETVQVLADDEMTSTWKHSARVRWGRVKLFVAEKTDRVRAFFKKDSPPPP
ncbi:hypothetical protein CLCR_07621 [Cladophialophora carrionii]|uniref:Uncharacterized protein n=1 Tax=Cladophialophora carrionii TaxID=86049 RepID=A0A1C1CMW5_9EURO|nr:hypothetical protein CLCR_07621 [Cladophialophora carrionii]